MHAYTEARIHGQAPPSQAEASADSAQESCSGIFLQQHVRVYCHFPNTGLQKLRHTAFYQTSVRQLTSRQPIHIEACHQEL